MSATRRVTGSWTFREWKGNKKLSATQIARQIREYRSKYPEKAILCSLDKSDGWLVLAAGGSVPRIPNLTEPRLLAVLPRMSPFELKNGPGHQRWALAEPGHNYFVYVNAGEIVRVDLSETNKSFTAIWFNPRTDDFLRADETIRGGMVELSNPDATARVLWLTQR